MFVSSTIILCLYVFAFCCINIKKIMDEYHCHLWRALFKSPVSGILVLYTFVTAWFIGGLTVFHCYLIFTNQVLISSLPSFLPLLSVLSLPALLIFCFCRQHMKIFAIVMIQKGIHIIVVVFATFLGFSSPKFPCLKITSGRRSSWTHPLSLLPQCPWLEP